MSSRIVIIGSGGRLGAALAREWTKAGDKVVGFAHKDLDLGNFEEIRARLEPLDYDTLVNCAALTNVDYCETHEEDAYRINAEAVRVLAELSERKRALCVHISTDYVFDGAGRIPYTEEDEAIPISVYGASKLAGEQALLETSSSNLAIRVSWVFGPDRPSFVDQILQRAREHEKAEAISDKWAVPTYTLDVARLLRPVLRGAKTGGIVHLCNSGECTWQEYGQFALNCAMSAGVGLTAKTVGRLQMADLQAFVAKRPPYTVLSTEKLTRLTGEEPRHWMEAVEGYIRECWAPKIARESGPG